MTKVSITTKAPIFVNEEAAVVNRHSKAIVERLSNNYTEIIRNMVGKSIQTKKTYTRNVEHFLAFIQANGINSRSVGLYRNALEPLDTISIKTKNAYLSATKALVRESIKYGILPVDISQNVPSFKVSRGHSKDGLTGEEAQKVLRYIDGMKRPATRRKLMALAKLLINEGLRQMEAQQLKVADINFKDQCIKIRRKGKDGKERFYILSDTAEALKTYVTSEEIRTGYLFPGKDGNPITRRAIRKYFTCPKYGIFSRCGIEGKSTHGFRHYNITETLKAYRGDLSKTRRRSGHAGFDMLMVYDDERMAKEDVDVLENSFAR